VKARTRTWSGSSGTGLVWALQAGFVTFGAAVGGG
jgi:hypothetical protein